MSCASPATLHGTDVGLMVYVKDVDKVYAQALRVGGTEVRPLQDQFYGDRSGTLKDPFGHVWTVATHVEDVSDKEMKKRMAEWTKQQEAQAAH
jgi:PhnB protein